MRDEETFNTDVPDWFIATGDSGSAMMGEHGALGKDDVRVEAYGACAEANSAIGVAIAVGQLPVEISALLTSVQNDFLDLAADLFVPLDSATPADARLSDVYTKRLERAVLFYAPQVDGPETRVLPGGTAASAMLYFARNVVRRAERALWRATKDHPAAINPVGAQYLNRLSTLLLLLARFANLEHGNIDWVPGASGLAMQAPDSAAT